MTWKRFNQLHSESPELALTTLGERWVNNIEVTKLIIKDCAERGWGYRVSSALFPCLTHPDFQYTVKDIPQYQELVDQFKEVSDNNRWDTRISVHPDQFNVLASENQKAVNKTILELNHHGWVLDMLGAERSYQNPINIHINNAKGDMSEIASRFIENFNKCNDSVKSRLVLENEDKGCWNVDSLYEHIYTPHKIPITYDNLHDKCLPSDPSTNCAELCASTWGDIKPLFHYSESMPGNNIRKHADLPSDLPEFPAVLELEKLEGKRVVVA
jgi:UV DNA damage endonuclease